MRILNGKKLEDITIIDNSIVAFSGQIENGIYVPTYMGDKKDDELKRIKKFLIEVYDVKDLRVVVKEFAGVLMLLKEYIMNNGSCWEGVPLKP